MKTLRKIILIIAFLIGLGIYAYPKISNWLARQNQIQAIQSYSRYVTGMSPEQKETEWRRAREYNDQIEAGPVTDPFSDINEVEPFTNYDTILNIQGTMGYLEIPAIQVQVPIYHGVSEEVLQKGVGHIKATALPIGGVGTHAVLSAHSGLPEAKLFSDLEDLEENDYFFIYVLDEELAYQVDQITIVDPDDISNLIPEEGKDYITLVTCTPIGINSHRLLVRGERCDVPREQEAPSTRNNYWIWMIVVILLLGITWLRARNRKVEKCKKRIMQKYVKK